ncbi:DeoR/GlpR family DNA-binding transcription regulator [Naumannella halotolerans]|uniref:DeoR family glycerol-3-phosphate regulon repressor/DeoR family fructose operon transcriptional repressor n=1 Tax=Naumannella halotolerans TaxID=993414 RepID=A0A4R7J8S7_9ACTN|nr:DeoR/GlpR family DNA-binding transcription regulator [Naumannella halotolerans]TDT33890.1 DeoR family glycerol-3-phosphate regulon repressor/DeoR family fructose operon transcriptional repressor [Naumannella halotolerans]
MPTSVPDPERTLPAGRKARIASLVSSVGEATIPELAARFSVSVDTIRRDLDQLHAEGVVHRTRGGAIRSPDTPKPELSIDARRSAHIEEKALIGEVAASLVHDGMSVMLNAGTTCLAVARCLGDRRDLIIATNNLLLPAELEHRAIRNVYLFGGEVRLSAQATIGPVRFDSSSAHGESSVLCDIAFITVGAASVDGGFSTGSLSEATMMREMIEHAQQVVLLVDGSKLGKRLFAQVCEFARPDYLVTDREPPADFLRAAHDQGVTVKFPAPLG